MSTASTTRSITELTQLLLTPPQPANLNLSTDSLPCSPMGFAFSPDEVTLADSSSDYFSSTTTTTTTVSISPVSCQNLQKNTSSGLLRRLSRRKTEHDAAFQTEKQQRRKLSGRMKNTVSSFLKGKDEGNGSTDRQTPPVNLEKKGLLRKADPRLRRNASVSSRKTPSISPPILPSAPPTLSTESEHVIQMTKLYQEQLALRGRAEVRRSRSFSGFKGGLQWDEIVAAVSKEELAKDAAARRGVATVRWRDVGSVSEEAATKGSSRNDGISLRF
ncbi:hypothetical protein Moror_13141 [Moniliophthora roreri MCA 2997]|uniref:Uncharacterized protein n=1 Tax=Moniliophthora roreri (strain MCA 2997) TaxID=1381753 RepID=V2X5A5_MONRO|nr:hypothetical protein Moror_13141 [Moniliophthora roreri MCA 2997]